MIRFFIILMFFVASPVLAQEHGAHDMKNENSKQSMIPMAGMVSQAVPMSREGSGTSWHPDDSPLIAVHGVTGNLDYMIHYNAFLRYTAQDLFENGSRGDHQFDAPNWAMGMIRNRFNEKNQLTLRAMMSLDRLTEGGNGYPLLFQSGETWNDKPLVDRQHPHELFSELGILYSRLIQKNSSMFLYFGLPGEPALGPPAYMHRPSAQENPDAPLGHHWQDATHITFGVATLGWIYHNFKMDVSLFNGREPDENRYDIDKPRFNSWSGRFSWNPLSSLAFQISHGFQKEPERIEPGIDIRKTMASLLCGRITENNISASAFVWGINDKSNGSLLHSLLAEYQYRVRSGSFYTRIELIEKDPEDLELEEIIDEPFWISANTFGITRSLIKGRGYGLEIGLQGILYGVPGALSNLYGDFPVSGEIFLRFYPNMPFTSGMTMNHSGMH